MTPARLAVERSETLSEWSERATRGGMTPGGLEPPTFGLGTPGTGSQAFPIFPYSLRIQGIC